MMYTISANKVRNKPTIVYMCELLCEPSILILVFAIFMFGVTLGLWISERLPR